METNDEESWYWYSYKDSPIQLDPNAYPSLARIDGRFPIPNWICVGPNMGIHLKYGIWRELDSVEVHLKTVPPRGKGFCRSQYGVTLLESAWMQKYIDKVPEDCYRTSELYREGTKISDWLAIVTRSMPRIRSLNEVIIPGCPFCGAPERYKPISQKCWLDIRDKCSDIIFSTWDGFFLRSDVADQSKVNSPKGAFRYPNRIAFR